MTEAPVVSVVVPARNEEADIAGCIHAIGRQDHGPERIQLILVDSASSDATVGVALEAASSYPFAEVIVDRNPRGRTSISLNLGLEHAKGDYVARVDARSRIPSQYVTSCLRAMDDAAIGVVGGAQIAEQRSDRPVDVAIARALRNRLATGLSRYRLATASGPSDTVWMGFFRTGTLRGLGGWDEELVINEDYELNTRFRREGWTVWFDHSVRSGYLPRRGLRLLGRQYFAYGRAKGQRWASGDRPALRHIALLAVPPGMGGLCWLGWRRFGPAAALTVPAALLCVEAAGSDDPTPLEARALTATAIAVLSGSWWVGTAVGFVGAITAARRRDA